MLSLHVFILTVISLNHAIIACFYVNCYKSEPCYHYTYILQTFTVQRDRLALEQHLQRCKPNTREWFLVKGALSDKVG